MKKTKHRANTKPATRLVLNATTSLMAITGLLGAPSAWAATTAVADDFSIEFGSTSVLQVLANDSYNSKQDGTPLVAITTSTTGFSVVDNQISYAAPQNSQNEESITTRFEYTITDIAEGFGDRVSPTILPSSSASTATEIDTSTTAVPVQSTILQQAGLAVKTPWAHVSGKEYLGVSTAPALTGLPLCAGAKYRVNATFTAQKFSGDARSKLVVSIGDSTNALSPALSTNTAVNDAPVAWPNSGSVSVSADYSGNLADLRVGVFVLNETAVSGGVSDVSKFGWAPVSLEVNATSDTSGCAMTSSSVVSTVTASGNFDNDTIMRDDTDPDDDNDGISDVIEGGASNVDTDEDGSPDRVDLDSDNDGIPDRIEGAADPDGDNIPNFRDLDSDGDGISDTWEAFHQPNVAQPIGTDQTNDHVRTVIDTDGDGVNDYLDLDSDNDGIQDVIEEGGIDQSADLGEADSPMKQPNALRDQDQDGIPNVWDLDSDNDTIPDIVEGQCFKSSTDSSCLNNLNLVTTTTGQYTAPTASDFGWASAYRSTGNEVPNSDGDKLESYLDVDDDNDGEMDIAEAGYAAFDVDNDGMIDSPQNTIQGWSTPDGDRVNSNPLGGSATVGPYPDTDADGIPDFIEITAAESDALSTGLSSDTLNGSDKIQTGLDANGGGSMGAIWLGLFAALSALARRARIRRNRA